MRTVIVNGDALTVDDVVDVANGTARAELAPEVPARMEFSRAVVAAAIAGRRPRLRRQHRLRRARRHRRRRRRT